MIVSFSRSNGSVVRAFVSPFSLTDGLWPFWRDLRWFATLFFFHGASTEIVEGTVGLVKFVSNFIRIAERDGVTSARNLIDSLLRNAT